MYLNTNAPLTPAQLGTINPPASENDRLRLTRTRKIVPARRSRCPGDTAPVVNVSHLDRKIQACLDTVDSPTLRQFLATVVHEPEVREVFAASGGYCSRFPVSWVDAMRSVALAIRQHSPVSGVGRDIVYVAALLLGIQHGLTPYVVGNANLNDVMFTIVRGPLHRLDVSDPGPACLLRLCMGWGNPDEALELAEQLQQMMLRATRAMGTVLRINASNKGA